MPLYSFEGVTPTVDPSAFVAPIAVLIGDVTLEANASVWFGAVLRGDYCPIVVREGANVQDNSVLHGNALVEIGRGATVAHNCVVHSAVLGTEALVANGCVVLDGVRIGAGSLVAAGSVVTANTVIPDGVLAAGAPAVVKRPIEGTAAQFWIQVNPEAYQDLARRHREGLQEL